MLSAQPREHADRAEAQALVQRDRAEVRAVADHRDHLPEAGVLAEANQNEPEILMCEVDMERSEHVRRIWPFLRDRRIDAYGDLLRRYRD